MRLPSLSTFLLGLCIVNSCAEALLNAGDNDASGELQTRDSLEVPRSNHNAHAKPAPKAAPKANPKAAAKAKPKPNSEANQKSKPKTNPKAGSNTTPNTASKCSLKSSRIKRAEVAEGEVESSSSALTITSTGCSGVFIWADKLYAAHVFPMSMYAETAMAELREKIGKKASSITHVVIVEDRDEENGDDIEDQLGWANKRPSRKPFAISGNQCVRMSATFANKGVVSVN